MVTAVKPRLCFVGAMVGRNPGYVTTQGEKLSDLFESLGYPVISVSDKVNRFHRLGDIVSRIVLSRKEIDILIVLTYGLRSFVVEDAASFLGTRLGLPLIMSLHGGAMPSFMARFPRWTKRVLERAQIIVSQSSYLEQAILPYGFSADVIPNVIDVAAYPFRLRTSVAPRLFWMRAFRPEYNPELALRVLERVRFAYPNATLVMGGQGNAEEMKRCAQARGLGEAVRFPGFLDMAGKLKEGGAADIYINTNRIDNRPVGVVEACALGLPVVATAVGGVPYMLKDEETALLCPDDDAEAMAASVIRLVKDSELACRLSKNGRALACLSARDKVAARWEDLFVRLVGPYSRSHVS